MPRSRPAQEHARQANSGKKHEEQENAHPNYPTVNNIIINNYHGGVVKGVENSIGKSFNPQAASFYPFFPQEQQRQDLFAQDDSEQLRSKKAAKNA